MKDRLALATGNGYTSSQSCNFAEDLWTLHGLLSLESPPG